MAGDRPCEQEDGRCRKTDTIECPGMEWDKGNPLTQEPLPCDTSGP